MADTFWTNPQYRVTVVDTDTEDDDDTGYLIIALLQRERRSQGAETELLTIGYTVYKVSIDYGADSKRYAKRAGS